MDITQDMALCASGLIRHDYFSLSDEESLQRRRPALRELPRAAGGYDWYAAHGLAFPSEEALVRHLRAAIPGGQLAFGFRLPREFTLEPRKSAMMQTIVRVLQETAGPGDFGCAANEASGVCGLFIRPDTPAQ